MTSIPVFTREALKAKFSPQEYHRKLAEEAAKKREEYDASLLIDFKVHLRNIEDAAACGKTKYTIPVNQVRSSLAFVEGISNGDIHHRYYKLDRFLQFAWTAFPDSKVFVMKHDLPASGMRETYMCHCVDVDWS